jgi:hypothetical protein
MIPVRLAIIFAFRVFAGMLADILAGTARQGCSVEQQTLREPRPLKIYVVKVDPECSGNELAVALAEDPDGEGSAESFLMEPGALAKTARLEFAVTAAP